jgi:hypothetical protein
MWGKKMKKIVSLVFLLILAGCSQEDISKESIDSKKDLDSTMGLEFSTKSSGSTNSGDVSIELTPRLQDNNQLKVDISVNTHSVTLSDFDLMLLTELSYGDNTIRPISAQKLSGHHSSGTLIFEVESKLDDFEIKIRDIPKVKERVFRWSVGE